MFSRRTTLWLLMLATAVAAQAGGGSTAQASCGDYLIGQSHRQSQPVRDATPTQQTQQSTSPFSKILCDGPGCQKAPAGPTAPVPVQLSHPETQRLGCLFAELVLTPVKQTLPEADHSELRLSGHPSSIEHPPRT